MYLRILSLGLVTSCAVAAALVYGDAISIPAQWNPWAPLSIADQPNVLTRYKLSRLSSDAAGCRAVLSHAQMRYTPLPDRRTGDGCGFDNAVRIEATTTGVGEPFSLSCRSAVALALWERHVMQPAAHRYFAASVARLEHFGSYSCRNVYGREDDRRSQHATADALDVAGFVLSDGRRIRVLNGWRGDARDAAFLRDVHAGACRVFDAVLGPDYNAAHHDHFHLDRGSFKACR